VASGWRGEGDSRSRCFAIIRNDRGRTVTERRTEAGEQRMRAGSALSCTRGGVREKGLTPMVKRTQSPGRMCGRAFTLIELLVVVSIIALLISILLPSLQQARNQAKHTLCRSNMHQLGLAISYYIEENKDRIPWIKGSDIGGGPTNFPFRQYHQILHMQKYLKNMKIYLCPMAKSGKIAGRGGMRGPRSVKGYAEGVDISYYTVLRTDSLFKERRGALFPSIPLIDENDNDDMVDELYTEMWFNDWNEGAGSGTIPAISGNVITRIPHPNHAVMMMDAIDWNPRHNGGNHFLFVDAHVDAIPAVRYFDPEGRLNYERARDKDAFGNRPYWCWGLGRNIVGDQ
jgi:prepilin-type N-terminal cleavage/methylation domain-containing protein/prepilin-type processing-associated H-X9-DG protein